MIYCVLCGSHVPGHDMVQAWGATVCRSHITIGPSTKHELPGGGFISTSDLVVLIKNKPAPDIDIRG